MEFKAFPKIEKIGKQQMQITQKIHGTNAQIFIREATQLDQDSANMKAFHSGTLPAIIPDSVEVDGKTYILLCGSRTRWIYPGDDNYGFAAFVHSHKEEFIRKLGVGQHFGEWAGLGINSGEGMLEKFFVLFDFWKYPPERPLPPNTLVVPVLYQGPIDLHAIDTVMADLKTSGSKLAPGFMRPEGVVIMMNGIRYKKVFQAEETAWKKGDSNAKKLKEDEANKVQNQFGHLLQPVRLEKLLSRDERYLTNFPKNLPQIVNDYLDDLISEGQIPGSPGEVNGIRKMVTGEVFKFIRVFIEEGQAA